MADAEVIWDAPGYGLGDLWSAISYCARRGSPEKPALISRWASTEASMDQSSRIQEMLNCLDVPVKVASEPANTHMWMNCWGDGPYFPTRTRWGGLPSHAIAVQFDGKSNAERKNAPPADLERLDAWARAGSWSLHPVGFPFPLATCIDIMSHCELFLGVDSGMSHVAHSVGIPVHLLEYEHAVAWWHGRNPFTLHKGVATFIESLPCPLK